MKNIFILFLLIIGDITYGTDVLINRIFFDGLKRIAPDTVLYNLPLKTGTIVSNEDIANSIKMLFATGYFEEIAISSDRKGMIVIRVKERPVINNISFQGNKIIKEDIIKKILNTKKICLGALFNECSIFEVKQELEHLYRSLGKFTATTKIVVIPLSRNRINLQIVFTEGKTAKMQQINIFGNNVFCVKKLLLQFKLSGKTKWWNILFHKQYQQEKLLYDLERLRNFYFNHGYAKFQINETQIDLSPDKKNVYFSLYITEGSKYSFESLVLHGNILDSFPNIKKYIYISSGEIYSTNKIQEIEYNIRYFLSKYGYIKPIVTIESDINDQNKTVKLYIHVDIGYSFYVREIHCEGNNITKDTVIRREIHQTEHTRLDYARVMQDQERLKRLYYFKTVNIHIKPVPDTFDQVDIIYNIEEHNTGNLNLSVGMGTESGINLQFGMSQDNVLGSGNSISISGTKNNYQNYAEISFLNPYYNIDNISIGGKLFYNDLNTNNTSLSDYNLKDYGININCSYPLIEFNKLNIGVNYVSNYLSKIAPQIAILRYLTSIGICPQIPINSTSFKNIIHFHAKDFLLISGWNFDNSNHMYFPTCGSRVNLLGTLTLPGSSNNYYKITINGSNYIPLDQYYDWILITSIHAGYAGSIRNKESPFYDNFYAGGIGTIRGFRLNSIGPKAVYYYCNYFDKNYATCTIKNSQDTIGGNAMILFKTELMVPISYLNQKYVDTARISLFLDTGTIWDTFWKNTEITRAAGIINYSIPNNIRISSGIALKWMSPIGPVIFSYSKLIKKYTGDIAEPLQFSIGKTW